MDFHSRRKKSIPVAITMAIDGLASRNLLPRGGGATEVTRRKETAAGEAHMKLTGTREGQGPQGRRGGRVLYLVADVGHGKPEVQAVSLSLQR